MIAPHTNIILYVYMCTRKMENKVSMYIAEIRSQTFVFMRLLQLTDTAQPSLSFAQLILYISICIPRQSHRNIQ